MADIEEIEKRTVSSTILDFDDEEEDMLVSQLNMDINNQYVVFSVGKEEYGIPILMVQEIISIPEITKVPGVADYIPGIINLRGNIIPLYSLRDRFDLPPKELNEYSIVIIVQIGDIQKKTVGLIVDTVSDVISITADDMSDTPPLNASKNIKYIERIGMISNRMIIIMNLDNFFTDEEESVLDQVDKIAPISGNEDKINDTE